jgi:hypothetical protein
MTDPKKIEEFVNNKFSEMGPKEAGEFLQAAVEKGNVAKGSRVPWSDAIAKARGRGLEPPADEAGVAAPARVEAPYEDPSKMTDPKKIEEFVDNKFREMGPKEAGEFLQAAVEKGNVPLESRVRWSDEIAKARQKREAVINLMFPAFSRV